MPSCDLIRFLKQLILHERNNFDTNLAQNQNKKMIDT